MSTRKDTAGAAAIPREALAGEIPTLRAFAHSLCRDRSDADDLVQETLLKALKSIDSFEPGTNLRAWLFTILRNTYYSAHRKRKREVPSEPEIFEDTLVAPAAQDGHMDLADLKTVLFRLADEQREAIVLVGAEGMSYEEAAEICGCAVGTIKSRVSRARILLAEMLEGGQDSEGRPTEADKHTDGPGAVPPL